MRFRTPELAVLNLSMVMVPVDDALARTAIAPVADNVPVKAPVESVLPPTLRLGDCRVTVPPPRIFIVFVFPKDILVADTIFVAPAAVIFSVPELEVLVFLKMKAPLCVLSAWIVTGPLVINAALTAPDC